MDRKALECVTTWFVDTPQVGVRLILRTPMVTAHFWMKCFSGDARFEGDGVEAVVNRFAVRANASMTGRIPMLAVGNCQVTSPL